MNVPKVNTVMTVQNTDDSLVMTVQRPLRFVAKAVGLCAGLRRGPAPEPQMGRRGTTTLADKYFAEKQVPHEGN